MDPQKETTDIGQLWASTVDTITLNDTSNLSRLNMTTSSITAAVGAIGSNTYPYTISTGISQPWGATHASPKIKLNGKDADIEINGESVMDILRVLKERMNYLQINPELEQEWSELKELGDQYRKLEQHIRDKQDTWDRLKAMHKPDVD